ncbi:hemolysin secretion protein D [Phenylobacterium sp. Root77]|jgi:membrane fusion protein (multidrug efflux system)|uniref:HlyD family secretion protein n=1 Tax=unclassified Phenylobacterium TaxID=2640670 RepID=UPI0006FA2FCE|nr:MULTISPECIES: HlyD family secretion protein [unclassified Phenylobacterium]KQW69173.1 hemolysin secretion protein D [Phenylobacterium sp. Root1277]KQW95460.1 hemolysin secretion protein D [Phenylobacterium sp. Root1290]KRC41250.1 hemolysin secretion protein D [Phenylobacterium sp. Root77]
MAVLPKKFVPLAVGGVVAVALVVGGGAWWMNKQKYEATDNAFIQADKVTVAPQVDGYVAEVLVADNQHVQAGQVLVRLDTAPLKAALAQAQANAAALDAAVRAVDDKARLEQAMIAQKAAGVASAHAESQLAQAELARYGALAGQGWVSPQREQSARAAAGQATASVAQAKATLEAERRTAQSLGSARAQTVAQADAARAVVEQARIDLERAEIKAPAAGVVGARAVRTGQYVRPGSSLMTVVPLGQAYVVANFKETQVARLKVGQPVTIHADAFGKQEIKGHIDSFAPATGSEFALIPVENAVGNFTKIAQRLPVKIVVDPKSPLAGALRPGLSVEVKVDVTADTGPSFAEATPSAEYARRGVAR